MATAMRPQGFAGSPLPLCSSSSCQVRPPSVVLKKPLPLRDVGLSPPDRKVQPFRRKSHMPAKRTFGSPEFIEIIERSEERRVGKELTSWWGYEAVTRTRQVW